eukprot:206418_1
MAEEHKDLDVVVNEALNQASWTIEGDLMDKFKNANNGEYFSVDFSLHGCWAIDCYPNGNRADSIDHFSIFLQCKTLPNELSKVGVNYQIAMVETNVINNGQNFFVEGTEWG